MDSITINILPNDFKPLPIVLHSACAYFKQTTMEYLPGMQDFYQILFVLDGKGTLYCSDEVHPLKKGSAFFTSMGVPSKYINEGGLVTAFLTVTGDAIPQMQEHFGCGDFFFTDDADTEHFASLIKQIVDEYYSTKCEGTLSALSYAFYTEFFGKLTNPPIASLHRTALYMEKNFAGKLTLDELAKINGSSVSKLCHDFKSKYGCTVFEHIMSLRLNYAYNLLNSGRAVKTKDAAASCGFDDVSYFCRSYKKKFGVSPTKKM